MTRRIAILAEEFGFERQRLHGWALAQAVLSAWWSYEDGEGLPQEMLAYAGLLATIKL